MAWRSTFCCHPRTRHHLWSPQFTLFATSCCRPVGSLCGQLTALASKGWLDPSIKTGNLVFPIKSDIYRFREASQNRRRRFFHYTLELWAIASPSIQPFFQRKEDGCPYTIPSPLKHRPLSTIIHSLLTKYRAMVLLDKTNTNFTEPVIPARLVMTHKHVYQ